MSLARESTMPTATAAARRRRRRRRRRSWHGRTGTKGQRTAVAEPVQRDAEARAEVEEVEDRVEVDVLDIAREAQRQRAHCAFLARRPRRSDEARDSLIVDLHM